MNLSIGEAKKVYRIDKTAKNLVAYKRISNGLEKNCDKKKQNLTTKPP